MMAEIADLRAALAAAERDAERLDWIEKNKTSLYEFYDTEVRPCTDGSAAYRKYLVSKGWVTGIHDEPYKTPRHAIDAAMSMQKGEKSE